MKKQMDLEIEKERAVFTCFLIIKSANQPISSQLYNTSAINPANEATATKNSQNLEKALIASLPAE